MVFERRHGVINSEDSWERFWQFILHGTWSTTKMPRKPPPKFHPILRTDFYPSQNIWAAVEICYLNSCQSRFSGVYLVFKVFQDTWHSLLACYPRGWNLPIFRGPWDWPLCTEILNQNRQFGGQKSKLSRGNSRGEFTPRSSIQYVLNPPSPNLRFQTFLYCSWRCFQHKFKKRGNDPH